MQHHAVKVEQNRTNILTMNNWLDLCELNNFIQSYTSLFNQEKLHLTAIV